MIQKLGYGLLGFVVFQCIKVVCNVSLYIIDWVTSPNSLG